MEMLGYSFMCSNLSDGIKSCLVCWLLLTIYVQRGRFVFDSCGLHKIPTDTQKHSPRFEIGVDVTVLYRVVSR